MRQREPYIDMPGFMLEPKSRGSINVTQSDIGQQPNLQWQFYSDGSDPNDAASGLSDPDSDVSSAWRHV